MKRVALALAVVSTMAYGAFLSFNYEGDQSVSASQVKTEAPKVAAKSSSTIPGVVVPLAQESSPARQKFFVDLSKKTFPKRIVIVAGDSNLKSAEVKIYGSDWVFDKESVLNDKVVLESLTGEKNAVVDDSSFSTREDIKSLIRDFHTIFADSFFTALLIPQDYSDVKIQALSDFLYEGDSEAMVVAAITAGDGLPSSLAKIHESNMVQALASRKSASIKASDCDSPNSLLVSYEYAKSAAANYLHRNPSDSGNLFAYWDRQMGETVEKSTSFIVAGDAMFDRNVWHNYKNVGLDKIFDQLPKNLFRGVDLSMLNHEGPISTKDIDDDYKSGSMVFNFPPVVPQILADLGINAVSLANNHSSNAGATGFANTQKVLSAANISNFGRQTGFNAKEDIIHQDGAIPLSIIGIDTLAKYDEKSVLAAIKKEKTDGYFVMVFPHWGEEYKTVHNASQTALANKWIDAGAGLIVGSHPHVVQDFEVLKGVPVVYSLGNFVFDQFFSDDTQHGLLIAGAISEKKITLSFLPTKEVLVKPELLTRTEKSTAIAKVFNIDSAKGFVKIADDTIEIVKD